MYMYNSVTSSGSVEAIPKGTKVFLAGPPLSGKSAVGSVLSTLLGIPFSDLDSLVEVSEGASVEDVFRESGERVFRELEAAALTEAASGVGSLVLALGGGALLDHGSLDLVLASGILITLWADPAVLEERMRSDTSSRPLSGDPMSLLRLMVAREAHYLSLPNRIDTTGLSVMEVAHEAEILVRDRLR